MKKPRRKRRGKRTTMGDRVVMAAYQKWLEDSQRIEFTKEGRFVTIIDGLAYIET